MLNFQKMSDFQKSAKFSTKQAKFSTKQTNFLQQKMPEKARKQKYARKSQIIPETLKMPNFQKNVN